VQRAGSVEIEYRYRHPEKGPRWIYSKLRMMPTSQGKSRMLGISMDVTERKRLEAALRETAESFQSTFEHANVGIAHVSLDGRYLRVNRKLCEMMGYTVREMLQLRFVDLTAPEYIEEDWRNVHRMISGDTSSLQREKIYIRKNGERVWMRAQIAILRNADGVPQYFVTVMDKIGAPQAVSV
jgi:PAS domain S-box-containing protein